jgi:HB1, ASXL, restriction endonuclease HTH domain
MNNKNKNLNSPTTKLPKLTIGSRVRCTDDGIQGRIVWANAVAVKIRWDDGEQVTWRRDSLAGRPIEFLTESGDEDQQAALATTEQSDRTEAALVESEAAATTPVAEPASLSSEQTPADSAQAGEAPPSESCQQAPAHPEQPVDRPEAPSHATTRTPKSKKAGDGKKQKKLSAVDAAAKILGETGKPMGCKELIEAMAAKGYWSSPGGKTPEATLYSAMLREAQTKGTLARFRKAEPGTFALAAQE